ncbi:ornithine cyclodeaminase family protein [Asanoa sp. WMMD1127]|uniref:ornithine cyclodeaminase family protein n=1 Tax=Asanoa sp. WMMD1127 TaxID=3016107 RepID=UPI002416CBE9|nr:ornithine cyclodeaminase family protein [Asanoa sp. WMMD1127]MDG4823686.1 ornithine cyclodeaminase family protein [Asanoa sp. WMMD1127]
MPLLLTDADVVARLDAPTAVAAMRDALVAAHAGQLIAPPRASAVLEGGRLVMTAGHLADEWYGFRSYDTFGHADGEQLVVLHDARDGRIRAIAVGEEIGSRRTGALGGAAVDLLARADAVSVGVIGSGRQAWTQVWATAAVRPVRSVRVFSRSAARRSAFAARVTDSLGLPAVAVDSAAAAVDGQDVVIVATTSERPVLAAADLAPGAHVNLVGFKQQGRAEFGLDLVGRAGVLATDSPAQAGSYDPPLLLGGTPLRDLGAIAAGAAPGRASAEEISVFLSVGLAGTEVFLLDRVAALLTSADVG